MSGRLSFILDEIAAERRRQVMEFGHDGDADAALPVHVLPAKVQEFAVIAGECARRGSCHDLGRSRRKLVQVAALAAAAIERIDAGGEALREREGVL